MRRVIMNMRAREAMTALMARSLFKVVIVILLCRELE